MKRKAFLFLLAILFLISGCFVYSFYPLYTEDDLFANDILLGEWMDGDSTIWEFSHEVKKSSFFGNSTSYDSTVYTLRIMAEEDSTFSEKSIAARIVKLQEYYFIDFFIDDHLDHGNGDFFDMYLFPVHVFAKLEFGKNNATIKYFNPSWLGGLIEENKIRIHHEKTEERVLLTAKPKELQKFVLKYVNSDEAFEDDYTVNLIRQ